MKKEIKGIVTRTPSIDGNATYQFIEGVDHFGIYEKATLVIDAPEKKISITESELREIFKKVQTPFFDGGDMGRLLGKLFGE